eukprot:13817186-Heterocapsa_arctica.AAC.1
MIVAVLFRVVVTSLSKDPPSSLMNWTHLFVRCMQTTSDSSVVLTKRRLHAKDARVGREGGVRNYS